MADAVVRGQSAESLLDQMAGRGANASHATATQGVVQRKTAGSSSGGHETTNPEYVNKHLPDILSRISDRITAVGVPQPHQRLNWTSYEEGARAVAWAIREYVNAAPEAALKRLMALSYPADMFNIVDVARRAAGGVQEVAAAIAYALDAAIHASIQRVGMRVVVQWDAHGGSLPKASSIVASCPLDGVIADVLTRRGNVTLDFHRNKGTGSKPFEHGVVEVEYEWMGKRDPNLWNWIHVKSPKDATAEHVAKTPLAGGEVIDGSEQAYRIASSPPYFGIPFETAKLVPDAFKFAPSEVQRKLKGDSPGPRVADDTALGNSVISREAAIAQAPAPTKSDESAERTVERCHVQIEHLVTDLAPWKLANQLSGVRQFIRERKLHIANDPKEAQRWQSVLAMQERILHAASSEVSEIAESIEPHVRVVAAGFGFRVDGIQSDAERRAGLGPVLRVLEAYANAAAVSQLGAQGPAALAKAREARALIPLAMTEQTIQFAGRGMIDEAGSKNEKDDLASYNDLTKRAADMRLKLAQGANVSSEDQQRLSVESTALATKTRLGVLDAQIERLMREADRVGEPQADYEGGLPTIRALPNKLRPKLSKWREDVDHTIKANDAELSLQVKEQRIAQVNGAIEEFGRQAEIKKWFEWAQKHTAQTELNNLINKIAIQIGVMIVTGEIAGAVVAGIRGVALAGELITEIRAASLMLKAGEILIHAGLNTAAQGLTGGPTGGKAFAENALAIVLGHAAMKPFLSLLRNSSAVEQEVVQSWRLFAKNGVKLAIEFTLETGTGIAASAVAHMATYGELSRVDSEEVIVQGISIAASKFVGQRVQRMRERIHSVKEQNAEFQKLEERVDALLAKTSKDGGKPTREDALRGLIESTTLLHEEAKLYGKQDVGAYGNAKDSSELDGSFLDVPLQLRRLSPIVDGHIYEGTPKDVHDAIADIEALGIKATVTHDEAAGVWRITADEKVAKGSRERTIEIRKLSEKTTHARPSAASEAARGTQSIPPENAGNKAPAPTKFADDMPRPQDLTPESWMQLQHLMQTHGEKQGLHEWRNLQEGRTADGVSITASIVPGSDFVGTGRATPDPAAVVAKAQQEMPSLSNLFAGQVTSITPNGRSFAITLQDGTIVRVHVMAAQLPYAQVARSQVNTQRGEHTIQISNRIADEQVQRALAHEVGEIIAETKNAKLHGRTDREDLLGGK